MVASRAKSGPSFEAFILAGGVSRRMRRAKHLLDFGGVPLILQTVRLVTPLVRKITVIGANRTTVPAGIAAIPDDDFRIRSEINARNGPLAGIVTALSHSRATWNLILACDMPYLNSGWLTWLLERAAKSEAQVVVPRTACGIEPLAAVYHRDCGGAVAQTLLQRTFKVKDALRRLRLETLHESEWREFDRDRVVLNNINTPAEYEQAQEWFRNQGYITTGGKLERTPQPPLEIRRPPLALPLAERPLISRPPLLLALPAAESEAKASIAFPGYFKRLNGTE